VNCSECGSNVQTGARFCTHCGARMPVHVEPAPPCGCGSPIPPGGRFCPQCGAPGAIGAPGSSPSPPPRVPPPEDVPAPQAPVSRASRPPTLKCPRCDGWLPYPADLCPACLAGEPPTPIQAGTHGSPLRVLWLAIPLLVSFIGYRSITSVFSHTATLVLLLVVVSVMMCVLRRHVAACLLSMDRWTVLRPFWRVQSQVPKALRIPGAIVAPIVVALLITPSLNRMLQGNGFLVFVFVLAVNTVVAHLILAAPPPELAPARVRTPGNPEGN